MNIQWFVLACCVLIKPVNAMKQIVLDRALEENTSSSQLQEVAKLQRATTALHKAVESGLADEIKAEVKKGACVDAKDSNGDTALYLACRYSNQRIAVLKALLECGADPKIFTDEGSTPLHLACKAASVQYVELLVNYGADLEARNKQGETPLLTAVVRSARTDIVEFLLKKGANIAAKDGNDNTVLHLIQADGEKMAEMLIANEADIKTANTEGKIPLHNLVRLYDSRITEILLKRGVPCDARDAKGRTPLFYAVEACSPINVKFLLKNGAQVNSMDKDGKTPGDFGNVPNIIDALVGYGVDKNM